MASNSNKTVLIVDDAPENIAILGELLTEFNLKVATNGKKALNIIYSDTPIDIILLDVMMPELDGFEVARQLKSDPKYSSIPIIFLTAQSDIHSFIQGFELGADEYVTKPFDSDAVLHLVRSKLTPIS
ncbi:MAG: response regulator [Ignavibacteriales bacterium]|nr:response regulator [Ignavibacteriales bacterium]